MFAIASGLGGRSTGLGGLERSRNVGRRMWMRETAHRHTACRGVEWDREGNVPESSSGGIHMWWALWLHTIAIATWQRALEGAGVTWTATALGGWSNTRRCGDTRAIRNARRRVSAGAGCSLQVITSVGNGLAEGGQDLRRACDGRACGEVRACAGAEWDCANAQATRTASVHNDDGPARAARRHDG